METIQKIIEQLKESPMFYLFSSSKELFHSNFWYWLYTIDRHAMLPLFSDTMMEGDFTVKREQNKTKSVPNKNKKDRATATLDLAFFDANNGANNKETLRIVLENKVKDFPHKDQLKRIQAACNDTGGNKPEYILTTLFLFEGMKFDGWKIVTYKEIAEKIDPTKFTSDSYHQALIQDFKYFLTRLANLASALLPAEKELEYDFAVSHNSKKNKGEPNLFDVLNEVKLWEVYSKMRASHLIAEFQKQFSNEEICSSSYSINNQKATLHFAKNLDANYSIGIQIEGIQFRKFVSVNKDFSKKDIQKFAESLKEEKLFFDLEFVNKKDKTSFGNYGDTFRYQYAKNNNPIENPISFEKLFEMIRKEFQEIGKNRDKILNCIPK